MHFPEDSTTLSNSGNEQLKKGETVSVVGASSCRGHLLVEHKGQSFHVPFQYTELARCSGVAVGHGSSNSNLAGGNNNNGNSQGNNNANNPNAASSATNAVNIWVVELSNSFKAELPYCYFPKAQTQIVLWLPDIWLWKKLKGKMTCLLKIRQQQYYYS